MKRAHPRRVWFWLRSWFSPAIYRLVIVNLISDNDNALRGVLWRDRGRWLVLKSATFIKATGEPPVAIDGDVLVPRSNVAFLQVADADRT